MKVADVGGGDGICVLHPIQQIRSYVDRIIRPIQRTGEDWKGAELVGNVLVISQVVSYY